MAYSALLSGLRLPKEELADVVARLEKARVRTEVHVRQLRNARHRQRKTELVEAIQDRIAMEWCGECEKSGGDEEKEGEVLMGMNVVHATTRAATANGFHCLVVNGAERSNHKNKKQRKKKQNNDCAAQR